MKKQKQNPPRADLGTILKDRAFLTALSNLAWAESHKTVNTTMEKVMWARLAIDADHLARRAT